MEAADLLRSYNAISLQQIARGRQVDPKGMNKEALVALLARDLFDPDRIKRAYAGLFPVERALLDRVLLAGGTALTQTVRRDLEQSGHVQARPKRDYWSSYRQERGTLQGRGSPHFESVVTWLGVAGLLFTSGPSPYGGGAQADLGQPGTRLFVPEPVQRVLPQPSLAAETTGEPPVVRPADPGVLLRDVYTFLSLADQQPLPLTTRGQITKRGLARLDEAFQVQEGAAAARSEDDLGRLSLLHALLTDAGLVVAQLGTLAAAEGAAAFLSRPGGERLRQLYDAYSRTARWWELFRIQGLNVRPRTPGRPVPPPAIAARQRVLAELAELLELPGVAGSWIPLAHLEHRLRVRAYEFLFPRFRPSDAYYSSYAGYQSNPYYGTNELGLTFDGVVDEAKGWDMVEAGLIRVVVAEALHWLGVADLGYAREVPAAGGVPAAFRITAAGARLLRGEVPELVAASPHVVVQPNFQVFAFPPTAEDVLFRLDRLAERVRAEQVIEYRLTRESVYRAGRAGLETGAIIAFLEEVSRAPLPQNVRRTLEEWGALQGRIVIRRGAALLQATGGRLETLSVDSLDRTDGAVAGLLGRRLAPDTAPVPPARLEEVYAGLLKRGILPAVSEGPDEPAGPLLRVAGDGTVVFRHAVPSLFVLHALRAFAEEAPGDAPGGAWRLTRASLRRAAASGLDAAAILATLRRWHDGPLAPEVERAVQSGAKDWGRGALAQVTLLQVQSADALAGLVADPEIGPHLRPLPDAPTLAAVQDGAVEQLRALLEDRGMALDDRLLQ